MYSKYIKRILDFLLSLLALIILAVPMVIVCILVRIKLGKPVIFKQKRPGKDEKIFTLYKFRTMTDERDENGKLLLDTLRLTKFGRFLRNTSIDEIPELFNILKGDMAIVGPRPLLIDYLPLYSPEQRHRHDVRPGLTGLAQVNGRNTITWEDRFEYDIQYTKHITFIGDVKILFQTLSKVFKREGISSQTSKATMEPFRGYSNMKTPYFQINEQDLLANINNFKNALNKNWKNNKMAYSVKTNSLPWLLDYINKNDIMAETVSDEEYDLSKLCGFNESNIIFNGPVKSCEKFEQALKNGAIVNIDSKTEIEFIKRNKPHINGKIGLRINVNTDIFNDEDIGYKEDGFRFGFSEENGELQKNIEILTQLYPNKKIGFHLHVNTITRSIEAYKAIARYVARIIKKYNIKLDYIDFGGGFFGGVPGKPTADEYIKSIKEELINVVDENETTLIIEPGSAICASAIDFYTSVLEVKNTAKSRFVTTDGSRINIDPLWLKKRYLYSLLDSECNELSNRKKENKQIICGYTCMDHDRIMSIENENELKENDKIIYRKVGNYTITFGGMFIKYYPDVYVKRINGNVERIRSKKTVEDYFKLHS